MAGPHDGQCELGELVGEIRQRGGVDITDKEWEYLAGLRVGCCCDMRAVDPRYRLSWAGRMQLVKEIVGWVHLYRKKMAEEGRLEGRVRLDRVTRGLSEVARMMSGEDAGGGEVIRVDFRNRRRLD